MSADAPTHESHADVLARVQAHGARLCADLTRQRESLLAARPKRVPAGVDPAEGAVLVEGVIAAAQAVMAAGAAANDRPAPDPTAP